MSVQDVPNPLVHKVSMDSKNETRKARTRLEEIFEQREEMAARRFSAAELEKMALESENEARRLRGEPPVYKPYGGEGMSDDEKAKKDEERTRLLTSAKALIESGLEPTQVGQMLLGLNPSLLGGAGNSPVVTQGLSLKDVQSIIAMVTEGKGDSDLRSLIKELEHKVDELSRRDVGKEKSVPIDPVTFAQQQANAMVAWHKALEMIAPKPLPATVGGRPLDVVKEENRHAEKMEEIKADRDYKSTLTSIAADIPERIGHGLGGEFMRGEGGKSEGKGNGFEYITCSENGCGTKIPIPPGASNQIECPKCGSIYTREETTSDTN